MIRINDLRKVYRTEEVETIALDNMSLHVKEHEFVAIMGPSGCGKSTLLNILGLLDDPDSGSYLFNGVEVTGLNEDKRCDLRRENIGFVFQNFNLLPKANALKNVMVPLLYSTEKEKNQKERAMEMLKMVGLEERAFHKPNELSGGQKQRVAIARAMINDPAIILADEPTGALDSKTGHMVMDLFHKLHEEQGKTIVLITHSQELAAETKRIVTILDGKIMEVKADVFGKYKRGDHQYFQQ